MKNIELSGPPGRGNEVRKLQIVVRRVDWVWGSQSWTVDGTTRD